MRHLLPTIIAILAGLIILTEFLSGVSLVGAQLLDWVLILAAFAMLLGLLNVLRVHGRRLVNRQSAVMDRFYSLVLLFSLGVVLVIGLAGAQSPLMNWTYQYVYAPLGATMFSLLAFYMASAAYRVLRLRSAEAAIMLVVGLVILVGQIPMGSDWPILQDLREWVLSVPALAGIRGILIGAALGAITTGLRVLMGLERRFLL
ncbi:MAG: hypothetical protein KKA73_00905 [Chloroflexi bacterium]|nr:hypothetical protein [Chloroflexota bacterium]MBU1746222.1 hypothetical protein [Chloroflexota bacterium]